MLVGAVVSAGGNRAVRGRVVLLLTGSSLATDLSPGDGVVVSVAWHSLTLFEPENDFYGNDVCGGGRVPLLCEQGSGRECACVALIVTTNAFPVSNCTLLEYLYWLFCLLLF